MSAPRGDPMSPSAHSPMGVALARAAMLFALWFVIDQSVKPADLAVGILATIGATWLSLKLLPPASGRVRITALVLLLPRFLWQSLVAGIDVARRVFHPRLPLNTGFVDYPVGLPRGSARNAFEMISGLLPGSVPTNEGDKSIEYHCLDVDQPVVAQLAAEEEAYAKALLPGKLHA